LTFKTSYFCFRRKNAGISHAFSFAIIAFSSCSISFFTSMAFLRKATAFSSESPEPASSAKPIALSGAYSSSLLPLLLSSIFGLLKSSIKLSGNFAFIFIFWAFFCRWRLFAEIFFDFFLIFFLFLLFLFLLFFPAAAFLIKVLSRLLNLLN